MSGDRLTLMRGRAARLVLMAVLCLALLASSATGAEAYVYFSTDLGTISYDQALMVLALQGIVNRDAPQLYANTLTLHPWSGENPKWFANEGDAIWLQIYRDRGYTFETVTNVSALVSRPDFIPLVDGLVIYDPEQVGSTWIAMTIAGVEDRLPVTSQVLADLPALSTLYPDALDLRPIVTTKTAGYEWAVAAYLDSCSNEAAFTIGHDFESGDPGDIISLDYAVAKRAFVFDLSLDAATAPEEEALADVIVGHLTPPGMLIGWFAAGVDPNTYASVRGDYFVNGVGASNLSFHRQMPRVSSDPFVQTVRFTGDDLSLDPTKHYLAIMTTDGEAPQRLTRFHNRDWLDAERGTVPMNWGVNPLLASEFPVLFEYYYSGATDLDYFYSSATGGFPSLMPDQAAYASFLGTANALCDIEVLLALDPDLSPAVWDPFLAASGMEAVVRLQTADLSFLGSHRPVLPARFSWSWEGSPTTSASEIAADIEAELSGMSRPTFSVIYDGLMSDVAVAKHVIDLLPPGVYVFLRLDEMNELARQIDHFYDVGTKWWAHDAIEACYNAGIVQGYTPTYYRPTLPVDRAQMAVYVSRALAGGDEGVQVPTGVMEPTFSDVDEGHWAYRYVEYCASEEVVQGYPGGTYHPDEVVNRGQMAVYVARAAAGGDDAVPADADGASFTDVTDANEWAWCYRYVEYCAANGIVQGYADDTYRPANAVTRDQMAVYVARAFELPI